MTQPGERLYAGLSLDFWKFWSGQVISTFGSSFTMFALPLLVYQLTHSSVNLAISAVSDLLPYLLFGLVIGAWVDRTDRKRLMVLADLAFFALTISIPLLYAVGHLSIIWIYVAGFLQTTTFIAFNSAEFAAVPSLVPSDDLVTANGRIQASYQAATIVGPIIAGALAAIMPVVNLLYIDAASYIVSALTLLAVRRSFNQAETEAKSSSLRDDIVEGLRYVISHPVLRNISIMMAMVNFVSAPAGYELVLFAKRQLGTTNAELGVLFAANGAGVVLTGLLAGRLRKKWTFGQVALGALMINGLLLVGFAFNRSVALGVVLWGLIGGVGILFNINTLSLRQAIVPNDMLGRIMSIAAVVAWSAIPLGTLIGGFAIRWTGNVALVYAVMGALTFVIPVVFAFSPLGHAERYLPDKEEAEKAG
ncbi:MAG TPA: MFS transporter [Chloroflexota bacterium]|nr:MFS transporter [Chloroflexota bacterium]